jgi:DNA-binding NarL/FixJ family response regulator
MLRTGLEALVRGHNDFQLVAVADSLDEVSARAFDVVVALENGIEQTEGMPPIVLISPAVDAAHFRNAWRAGYRAVLPQDSSSAELIAAIEAAAAGLVAFRAEDLESFPIEVRTTERVALSPREVEVLRLVAEGLGNKEISFRLGISEHTVKFHVNSILTRMNAATRAEAVAIGIRQGLILL